jgi:hypothetical protein
MTRGTCVQQRLNKAIRKVTLYALRVRKQLKCVTIPHLANVIARMSCTPSNLYYVESLLIATALING